MAARDDESVGRETRSREARSRTKVVSSRTRWSRRRIVETSNLGTPSAIASRWVLVAARRGGIARRTASASIARGVSAGSGPACAALSPCAGVVNPTDGAGEFPSRASSEGAVRSESRRFAAGFAAPATPFATVARASRGFTPAAGSEEDGAGSGPATGAVAAKSSLLGIAVSDGIALAFAAPELGAPAPAPLGLKKLLMSFKGLVFFCVSIVSGRAFRTDAGARLAMELPRRVQRKLFQPGV